MSSTVPVDRLHVSFSQVSTYLRCPELFRLKYVRRAEPAHRPAELVFGNAVHGALAYYHDHLRKEGHAPALDLVQQEFSDLWLTAVDGPTPILWPDADGEVGLFEQGHVLLKLYVETIRVHRVLAVEKPFGIPVVDKDGNQLEEELTGVIDLIEQDENGQTWVTEVKTAARRFDDVRLQHDHQLSIYTAARHALGVPDARVRFRVLLKQKTPSIVDYEVPRQSQQVAETKHVIEEVLRAVKARIFYPVRSFQCTTCPYRSRCGE